MNDGCRWEPEGFVFIARPGATSLLIVGTSDVWHVDLDAAGALYRLGVMRGRERLDYQHALLAADTLFPGPPQYRAAVIAERGGVE